MAKRVDFLILGKALERATAHQAVIGVIEDDVYAENLHEFIKALCGGALEERIGLALVAHAVDDVAALHIFFDEAV